MRTDTYYLVEQDRDPDSSGRRKVSETKGSFGVLLRQAGSNSRELRHRSWIYASEALARSEVEDLLKGEPPPPPTIETEHERHKRILTGAHPAVGPSGPLPRTASQIWREVAGIPEDDPPTSGAQQHATQPQANSNKSTGRGHR